MSREPHTEAPDPLPPTTLLNRDNVGQLAKEIAGATVPQVDDEKDDQSPEPFTDESTDCNPPDIYKPLKRLMRTCLASLHVRSTHAS